MKLIATQTLTSAQPDITFSAIPQNFTDLYVLFSGRSTTASGSYTANFLRFNGIATNLSMRRLFGSGSSVGSDNEANIIITTPRAGATANTFGSSAIYIPNYTGSTNKSVSIDQVTENNASEVLTDITAGLWSNTAAITSLTIAADSTFAAGSTASLYGIGGPGSTSAKAVGGTVAKVGAYWVHTFTSSGIFYPLESLTNVEYLVVAGGGGGGGNGSSAGASGGGGAGGYRSSVTGASSGGGASAETKLSLTANTAYAVTVGAGGANATNGSNSVFGSITSTGGGRGGTRMVHDPSSGGSGGGGYGENSNPGAAGTTNQGYAGGSAVSPNGTAAGGGGAGSVGQNAISNTQGGNGGSGVASSITGTSVSRAGGGGGGAGAPGGTGTSGGGNGGTLTPSLVKPTAGTLNTGGGGGGAENVGAQNGAAGGSGIVVVRYLA
jgi:hypothetical protein